jgi:hypothetical protein
MANSGFLLAIKRAWLCAVCLTLVSATSPRHLVVQVFDQRGLPLHGAVVEIARPAGDDRPLEFPWRNAMAQRNETFVPGTLIVPAGSTVAFPNLDTVRHSIYSFSRAARFQIDLYGTDQTRSREFDVPGSVALGCHIHDQMKGYIRVTRTPYAAKSDVSGLAEVAGLPSGAYAVTVWYPLGRGPNGEWHGTLELAEDHPNRVTIESR